MKKSSKDSLFDKVSGRNESRLTEKDEKGRTIDSAKADKPHQADRASKTDELPKNQQDKPKVDGKPQAMGDKKEAEKGVTPDHHEKMVKEAKDRAEKVAELSTTGHEDPADASKCPDCKGEGIKSPIDFHVCQRCDGTGKV